MSTSACAGMYAIHVFLTSVYILETFPPQGVHVRTCMRSLFISVGGQGWGESASLCRALVDSVRC